MSSVYLQTRESDSATTVDMTALREMARRLVGNVMRHTRMDSHERRIFRDDLMQEALTQLYDLWHLQGHERPYAYAAARTNLIGTVFVEIRGGGRGHQWELSKQYRIDDNLTEPEYLDEDANGHRPLRLPAAIYRRRPVEHEVEVRESQTATEAFWQQFERETTRILAVMRKRQWHPDSLRQAAKALCASARGVSTYNIARMLGLEWRTATGLLHHYRTLIANFLALPPLVQGLLRAEGQLRLQWWDEVTATGLNSGQKFIVIMPHGAFTVGSYYHKAKGKHLCRLQAGRRVDGKLVNRSVQLGEVGQITRQRLWRDSQRLQAKVAALEAAV